MTGSGSRILCLDCTVNSIHGTMDFCPDPKCYSREIIRDHPHKPHQTTHRFLKTNRDFQWYDRTLTPLPKTKVPHQGPPLTTLFQLSYRVGEAIISGSQPLSVAASNHCSICRKEISAPFWCCAICSGKKSLLSQTQMLTLEDSPTDCPICDECESKSYLRCISSECQKKYRQPSWYYGLHPSERGSTLVPVSCSFGVADDTFQCETCIERKVQLPEDITGVIRHSYIHPLLRYSGYDIAEEAEEPSSLNEAIVDSKLVSLIKGLSPVIHNCTSSQLESVQQALNDLNAVMTELGVKGDKQSTELS